MKNREKGRVNQKEKLNAHFGNDIEHDNPCNSEPGLYSPNNHYRFKKVDNISDHTVFSAFSLKIFVIYPK